MTTAIEKAWEINLKLPEEMQFKHKEDLICKQCIFDDEYKIHIKGINDEDVCNHFKEYCTDCWNAEIEDGIVEKRPMQFENMIKQADNDRLRELFNEFLNEINGKQNIDGAYMFLQFLLKHE
jgi:hypothetical protein